MKAALVLLSAMGVVVVAAAEDKYTTKYDNVNVDEILSNERLLNKYKECMKEDTDDKCPPDGKELKRVIPDALSNGCAKCNDKQKEGAKKVIKHFINKDPEFWEEMKAKYDHDGKYSKEYEAELKELQG